MKTSTPDDLIGFIETHGVSKDSGWAGFGRAMRILEQIPMMPDAYDEAVRVIADWLDV